jgi:hypothetical protein
MAVTSETDYLAVGQFIADLMGARALAVALDVGLIDALGADGRRRATSWLLPSRWRRKGWVTRSICCADRVFWPQPMTSSICRTISVQPSGFAT